MEEQEEQQQEETEQSPSLRGKLKVSPDSWHYRFLFWGPVMRPFYEEQLNLCSYFWSVVFKVLILAFVAVLGMFLALVFTVPLISPFITFGVSWYLGMPVTVTWLQSIMGVVLPPGHVMTWHAFMPEIICWSFAAWLGFLYWIDTTEPGKKWATSKPVEYTFWRVTKDYLRARKEKFCPIIEIQSK